MKDILIGAIDRYSWKDIKPWCVSARESGFDGDIYLITYRINDDIRDEVAKLNIDLYEVNHGPNGAPLAGFLDAPGVPSKSHNLRMYHAWELLFRLDPSSYRYCIMTDVRDVIFQRNPSEWLCHNIHGSYSFVAPSEGIMFRDEEWNRDNLQMGYGPIVYDLLGKSTKAYNVGTIAGGAEVMSKLMFTIYNMTLGRHYPSDQSSFNLLVNYVMQNWARDTPMTDGWAAQLGTTHDPTKSWLWERLCEPRPTVVMPEGKVITQEGKEFALIHQWDRVPELKTLYSRRYGV